MLYIAIGFFTPAYWMFAPLNESPYSPLYDDIIRFSGIGHIVQLGDLDAQTRYEQTMFDTSKAMYKDVKAEEVGRK